MSTNDETPQSAPPPIARRPNNKPTVFIVLALATVAVLFMNNLSHYPEAQSSAPAAAPDAQAPDAAANAPAVSTDGSIGGLRYSIVSDRRASSIGDPTYGMSKTANGEFILIKIKVENVADSPATVSGSDFHLRRDTAKFDADSEASMYLGSEKGFFLDTINPGTSRTGTLVFDVPADTAPSKYLLAVYGNASSDSTTLQLR
ncbi:MAG: hypothetical protein JWO85_519 [Candidatus Eremiobacteraeota bacterium]|nr:hypothetical protein [Candidatus Eremiobacteraeota bacterium]